MVSAGENRAGALFTNDNNSTQNVKKDSPPQLINIASQQLQLPKTGNNNQPLRRVRSARGKRSIRKGKRVLELSESAPISNNDNEKVIQDEEESSLNWAYDILVKEFNKRNEIRDKNVHTTKRANDKLESLLAFKKLKEQKNTLSSKLKKDAVIKSDSCNNLPSEGDPTTFVSSKSSGEINTTEKVEESNIKNNDVGGKKKKGSTKRKVQILSLQDQIRSKKKLVAETSDVIHVNQIFKSNTEKEKIQEAKKALYKLNDRAEKKKIEDIKSNLDNENSTVEMKENPCSTLHKPADDGKQIYTD